MPRRGEFSLIETYFVPLATRQVGALGLKDDAALLSPPANCDLVFTKDAMVAGIHFLPTDPPDLVARKLLRVNLSDLAAMGADPIGYLLACAWPQTIEEDWIASFAEGLNQDQIEFHIDLLGGDTVSTSGPMTLSLTAIGSCPKGKAIRRRGAKPGDVLYVSGTIGDSGLGLCVATEGARGSAFDEQMLARYQVPEPRLNLGRSLIGIASSLIDVSDGLAADAEHLAMTSEVFISVDLERVPLSDGVIEAMAKGTYSYIDAVTAGDDYELLFTAAQVHSNDIANLADQLGIPIQAIGDVLDLDPGVRLLHNAAEIDIPSKGYAHF